MFSVYRKKIGMVVVNSEIGKVLSDRKFGFRDDVFVFKRFNKVQYVLNST